MERRILSRLIRKQHLQNLAARLTAISAGGHDCTTNNPCHNCSVWPVFRTLLHFCPPWHAPVLASYLGRTDLGFAPVLGEAAMLVPFTASLAVACTAMAWHAALAKTKADGHLKQPLSY